MKANPPRPPPRFIPRPFPYHEIVTVRITGLTNLGIGLGRRNNWVIMVPFSLPGEAVKARVWRNHKNFSEADLVEILTPSPQRVDPRCSLAGECGGCQYQHFSYEGQLEWKSRQVRELLQRHAGSTFPVNPIAPSPRQFGYRSKITPHFQKPRGKIPPPLGFQRFGSRRLLDVPSCPIATDPINSALQEKRRELFSGPKKYRKGGTLLLRDTGDGVVSDPNAVVSEKVGDFIFQFKAGEFFQNNPFLLPRMVAHVVAQARGSGLPCLLDAYCGVGVFSIAASSSFERVAGIEISALSIHWANANAKINKAENCRFFIGHAESIFAKVDFDPAKTALIVDPPRKGCHPEFLKQLFAFKPARVVYVSCDPATQARDLKSFLAENYSPSSIQPFDLFPQTRHIENVLTLARLP